jgi:hypothetical protein
MIDEWLKAIWCCPALGRVWIETTRGAPMSAMARVVARPSGRVRIETCTCGSSSGPRVGVTRPSRRCGLKRLTPHAYFYAVGVSPGLRVGCRLKHRVRHGRVQGRPVSPSFASVRIETYSSARSKTPMSFVSRPSGRAWIETCTSASWQCRLRCVARPSDRAWIETTRSPSAGSTVANVARPQGRVWIETSALRASWRPGPSVSPGFRSGVD